MSTALALVTKQAAQFGLKRLLSLSTQADFDDAVQKMVAETAFEVEAALGRLEARVERLDAASVKAEEFAGLFGQLYPEAVFAATKERRRLMAAAIAGIFEPRLSLEEKSRLARAIASLEPSDLVHLRMMGHPNVPDVMLKQWRSSGRGGLYSGSALERAGCIIHTESSDGKQSGYVVTALGKALLLYVADWSPAEL